MSNCSKSSLVFKVSQGFLATCYNQFLPAAQRHGHMEGGIGVRVGVGTFRSCSLFTSCLRHGLLEGEIGKLLGHLGPVPFFLNGKPQTLIKIFEEIQDFKKIFEKFQDS